MYIGPKSRTEKPKIGAEVGHDTGDSETLSRSKVNLQGVGHIVAAARLQLVIMKLEL